MANAFFPLASFKALLKHHIALIERFEEPQLAEFSLLYLRLGNNPSIELKKSVQIVFRDSDIIFEYNDDYIILLPKTDYNGAIELLKGLQEFLAQAFQDSIVTYPDDGRSAEELLENFSRIVRRYYGIDLDIS